MNDTLFMMINFQVFLLLSPLYFVIPSSHTRLLLGTAPTGRKLAQSGLSGHVDGGTFSRKEPGPAGQNCASYRKNQE